MTAIGKVERGLGRKGYPHVTERGEWVLTPDGVWTGGFWIGLLWSAYDETHDSRFRDEAETRLETFGKRAGEAQNHDLGMMYMPSAVRGLEITGNSQYRDVALTAAHTLAAELHPRGGFIPGWGFFGGDEWQGRVLVDTLMNLPLLAWAWRDAGATELRKVAETHLQSTLDHHIRADGSTHHVFRFDPVTGAPIAGDTYQGLSPDSCWSRGQAWAIAGLSQLGENLWDDRCVKEAERVAQYFLDHLPAGNVPPWDFSDPDPSAPRDSAAGAIAAYGLLRLALVTRKPKYGELAETILSSLAETCTAPPDHPAILVHATADLPHGIGVDESTIYGDYFYVRALELIHKAAQADDMADDQETKVD